MSDFTFEEREDWETGFSEVFDRQIAPYLHQMEERRRRAVVRSQRIIAAMAAASLFLAWRAFSVDPLLPIMPIAFGGFGCLFVHLGRGDRLQDELTRFIRPILCDFLPDVSYSETCSDDRIQLGTLEDLGLVPRADAHSLGPRISGTWRGVSYQIVKAGFFEHYRDHDDKRRRRTLFSGILLEIECWNPMPTIVFLPDFGPLANRVQAWATRNTARRTSWSCPTTRSRRSRSTPTTRIAPAQCWGLRSAGKSWSSRRRCKGPERHMPAAFRGNAFYLAIQQDHGFLDFDVMKGPLTEVSERIHQAFHELTIPRRVIDRLLERDETS